MKRFIMKGKDDFVATYGKNITLGCLSLFSSVMY